MQSSPLHYKSHMLKVHLNLFWLKREKSTLSIAKSYPSLQGNQPIRKEIRRCRDIHRQ